MIKQSVGIVGLGVVGTHLRSLFPWASCYDIHHFNLPEQKRAVSNSEFAFISVNTPPLPDGRCDITQVEEVVSWLQAKYICIKSTVPPGTTDSLSAKYSKSLCFSPEYQGSTPHCLTHPSFVILGGPSKLTSKLAQLYQHTSSATLRIIQTDSKTAELCKYMENCYLATKVVFVNEFYRLARILGLDYNTLRELWLQDSRINRSHTFVYESEPWYDSKCFNKDLPALVEHFRSLHNWTPKLIQDVIDRNKEFQKEKGEEGNDVS